MLKYNVALSLEVAPAVGDDWSPTQATRLRRYNRQMTQLTSRDNYCQITRSPAEKSNESFMQRDDNEL